MKPLSPKLTAVAVLIAEGAQIRVTGGGPEARALLLLLLSGDEVASLRIADALELIDGDAAERVYGRRADLPGLPQRLPVPVSALPARESTDEAAGALGAPGRDRIEVWINNNAAGGNRGRWWVVTQFVGADGEKRRAVALEGRYGSCGAARLRAEAWIEGHPGAEWRADAENEVAA